MDIVISEVGVFLRSGQCVVKRASMVRVQLFQKDNWIGTVFDGYESASKGLDKLLSRVWTNWASLVRINWLL